MFLLFRLPVTSTNNYDNQSIIRFAYCNGVATVIGHGFVTQKLQVLKPKNTLSASSPLLLTVRTYYLVRSGQETVLKVKIW